MCERANIQDRSYAYDLAGNMICNSGIDPAIAAASRKTYCDTNHNIDYPAQGATSVRPHAPSSIIGQPVAYDDNGNTKSYALNGDTRTLTYDGENRPTRIALTGGLATTFAYGPDGERIEKQVEGGGDESWYLGSDLELNVSSATPAGEWTQYVHGDVKRAGKPPPGSPRIISIPIAS